MSRRARPAPAREKRRGWDSNPRYLAVHTLSRRAESSTLAPLRTSSLAFSGHLVNRGCRCRPCRYLRATLRSSRAGTHRMRSGQRPVYGDRGAGSFQCVGTTLAARRQLPLMDRAAAGLLLLRNAVAHSDSVAGARATGSTLPSPDVPRPQAGGVQHQDSAPGLRNTSRRTRPRLAHARSPTGSPEHQDDL
jgi:hypothetical protein